MSEPNSDMLEAYFRLMNTNGAAQVYQFALGAGVLDALMSGSKSSEALAQVCDANPRSTRLLLEALEAMGVVQRTDDLYALTAVTHMLLGSDYRELGNQYWRHLPEFLSSGESLNTADSAEKSEEFYQSQAALLGWMLTPAAKEAALLLHDRFSQKELSILDVGAGSAVWSLQLAALHPQSRVTAVDWPAVLEVAEETAAGLEVTDRLTKVAGDWRDVELPKCAFDVAIVANLTHLQSKEENTELFHKLHTVLKANGELIIVDAFSGSPAGDLPFSLYHLGLALRTDNGHVYSPAELKSLLDESDFETGELMPLQAPPYVAGMLLCNKRG